jgi:hypothetical protein
MNRDDKEVGENPKMLCYKLQKEKKKEKGEHEFAQLQAFKNTDGRCVSAVVPLPTFQFCHKQHSTDCQFQHNRARHPTQHNTTQPVSSCLRIPREEIALSL